MERTDYVPVGKNWDKATDELFKFLLYAKTHLPRHEKYSFKEYERIPDHLPRPDVTVNIDLLKNLRRDMAVQHAFIAWVLGEADYTLLHMILYITERIRPATYGEGE